MYCFTSLFSSPIFDTHLLLLLLLLSLSPTRHVHSDPLFGGAKAARQTDAWAVDSNGGGKFFLKCQPKFPWWGRDFYCGLWGMIVFLVCGVALLMLGLLLTGILAEEIAGPPKTRLVGALEKYAPQIGSFPQVEHKQCLKPPPSRYLTAVQFIPLDQRSPERLATRILDDQFKGTVSEHIPHSYGKSRRKSSSSKVPLLLGYTGFVDCLSVRILLLAEFVIPI